MKCLWVNDVNEYYHDYEWGIEHHDDKYLYELLILEMFQAGLSWDCILKKRKYFKEALDDFDIDKIIKYDDKKINELLNNKNIIRNKLKIKYMINNSKIFKKIQEEYGSFDKYIWSYSDIIYEPYTLKTTSELSDKVSSDLKKLGMRFVGSTIIYSYLQAIGIIHGHESYCEKYLKN